MASKCCLILATMMAGTPALALEALDESSLSEVTGQAQGLRYTSEYDARIDSISYIDDDGLGADGTVGTISMSPIRMYTPVNRPVQIDLEIKEINGRKAVVFTNRDLPIELEVGSLAINGQSLGGLGQGNFQIADGDALVTRMYAGGRIGSGFTLDLLIPKSMRMDTYYEDEGARFTSTIDFSDPRDPNLGGLTLENITFDLETDGLRIGMPTINGGNINIYNARIGDDVLNSLAFRNIQMVSGGYLLIKNAEQAGEIGIEFDSRIAAGSSFELVYIAGEVDDNYPNLNVFEMSAQVSMPTNFDVKGMRMNVDGERGLVFDFDAATATDGVSGNLLVENITLQRSDKVGVGAVPASIGTLDMQVNLTQNSYLQVEGH
ncbi:DUF6160 family protein [Thalassolituus hydrocarboniclasticus]|uniref:DUF6160 domain-containing protein n=1 Tax=Thalassolituus hydrocarboniclasticus TaxID=2742796 RepID=A0ABY6A9L6_9GAMM|nr:DUF6160 family protein [Thalassolituus hydrocarboniclasticus]UXD86873.1 hypothetical protein HUF19_05180 [Thalassolituus hydrocarboniclasticus]